MRRKRRRKANRPPESYVSKDAETRARQLGSLRPTVTPGNRRHVTHGGYARVAAERLDAKVRDVFDAIAEDAPLRDRDGALPAADTIAVRMLAEALCRLEDVTAHLRDYGALDQQTHEVRPAVYVEAKLRGEVADWLDALGMTPRARAKLGLDVARAAGSFDLARMWADGAIDADVSDAG